MPEISTHLLCATPNRPLALSTLIGAEMRLSRRPLKISRTEWFSLQRGSAAGFHGTKAKLKRLLRRSEVRHKDDSLTPLLPGVMKTPVLCLPKTHEFLAELHPVGRMREIQDIVDAILFSGKRRYYHWPRFCIVDDGQSCRVHCQNGETA